MTSSPIALGRPTLADRLVPRSGALTDTMLVLGGTVVVAAFAQLAVPLWPVPVTGQTLAVMLVGATLGARRGALSLTLYLVLGLAGLPIFAEFGGGIASLASPSFGFVIGFVPAAALIGWLSERNWDRRPVLSMVAFLFASIVPFLFGLPYLGFVLGSLGAANDPATVIALGFTPFIVGGIVKWAIAAAVLPLAWKVVHAVDARR